MNSFLRFSAGAVALAVVGTAAPALAVLATDYVPPKIIHLGKQSLSNAGSGTVVIKVLVNPNGTFNVQNVVRSTNTGDNAAALDIARHSTYRAATRGGKPTTAFYDFTIKFNGKVASADDEMSSGTSSGGDVQIRGMLRAGHYAQAKTAAEAALAANPSDKTAALYLGLANSLSGDDSSAAAAYDKLSTVPSSYVTIAAQSYAVASIKSTDNAQKLAYAQKAVAMHADGNAYFALGVAQEANSQTAAAVDNLVRAKNAAFADKKTSVANRVRIDQELQRAYAANNDTANAQRIGAEIKALDPNATSTVVNPQVNALIAQANAAVAKHDFGAAATAFEQLGALDSTQAVTGYARAAIYVNQMEKPDLARLKADADKAVAANPNDPAANFAEGIALYDQYATAKSPDASLKQRALDALNKADGEAKAVNQSDLVAAIENYIKGISK